MLFAAVLPFLARPDQIDDATDAVEERIRRDGMDTDAAASTDSSECEEPQGGTSPLRPYHPRYGLGDHGSTRRCHDY